MAEGPVNLYSTRAFVFQINPETKASWLPKGDSAIPISFIAPANRRELNIIGTNDNGQTVLNCAIHPRTLFNKRSQKFGQWHDQFGMIYGLGFNSELELNEFMETFQQLQQDLSTRLADLSTRQSATSSQQSQPNQNSASDQSMERSGSTGNENAPYWWNTKAQQHQQSHLTSDNSPSEINGRGHQAEASAKSGTEADLSKGQNQNPHARLGTSQQHSSAVKLQQKSQENSECDTTNNNNSVMNNGTRYPRSQSMFGMQQQKLSSGIGGCETPDSEMSHNETREQLKHENERLKQTLEESSKNSGIWHSELINLRTNNSKLTQALQESKAHVKEWQKELLDLRDENKELKSKVMALQSTNDSERSEESKLSLQEYKNYIDELQRELKKKDDELELLQRSMEQLEIKADSRDIQNGRSDDATSSELVISTYQRQKLESITAKLDAKISELAEIREEYAKFSDKLYH